MDHDEPGDEAETSHQVDDWLIATTGIPDDGEIAAMRAALTALQEQNDLFGRPNPGRPPTCKPERGETRLTPRTGILRTPEVEERIRAYCSEETWRQGYDTETPRGAATAHGFIRAWRDAEREHRHDGKRITPGLIIRTAKTIEPLANRAGVRRAAIRIGTDLRNQTLSNLHRGLDILCGPRADAAAGNLVEALIWYWSFERVHPFMDGNGRTGKILLNLLLDRMAEPVFPPETLWGRLILNP